MRSDAGRIVGVALFGFLRMRIKMLLGGKSFRASRGGERPSIS